MATIIQFNRALSSNNTGKIEIDNIEHYSGDTKHVGDFTDPNDIPNVQAVTEIVNNAVGQAVLPPTPLTYLSGVATPTITNFQVNYSQYGIYPDIMVFYTDTGVEIKTATITRTPLASPTSVKVDAANDGTDHLDGNITVVIKQ